MRTFLALVLFTTTAAADVMVHDNKQTVTVDCKKDPNVAIHGNEATVTLDGTCENVDIGGNDAKVTGSARKVSVSGNKNTVTLTLVDVLAVSGNQNTVSYRSAYVQKTTKVANSGKKNVVKRVK